MPLTKLSDDIIAAIRADRAQGLSFGKPLLERSPVADFALTAPKVFRSAR